MSWEERQSCGLMVARRQASRRLLGSWKLWLLGVNERCQGLRRGVNNGSLSTSVASSILSASCLKGELRSPWGFVAYEEQSFAGWTSLVVLFYIPSPIRAIKTHWYSVEGGLCNNWGIILQGHLKRNQIIFLKQPYSRKLDQLQCDIRDIYGTPLIFSSRWCKLFLQQQCIQ